MKKLIIGITAADGVRIGKMLLELLANMPEVETHLIISKNAEVNFRLECKTVLSEIETLADFCYSPDNMAARISSGSFITDGMIIAPCSMKTLSAVANGYSDNLITRAADVCLKEARKLVLMPREMPLGIIHLRNMLCAAEAGCVIVPPMLTFYNGSKTIDDMILHALGKVLLQFEIEIPEFRPWKGE